MKTVRIFGLTLATGMPLAHHLLAADGEPELTCVPGPVLPGGDRLYDSGLLQLDRLPGMEILRFPPLADFALEPGRITVHVLDPGRPDLVELRLLGPVLSYWLERQGIPTLHASAVRLGHGAVVAFLARHGGGKSSLAATLMQAGATLLSDDVLPVEESGGAFLARPGYPRMRLEPDSARWFLGSTEGLSAVAPGETKLRVPVESAAFERSPLPLTAVYLAARRAETDGDVEAVPLTRREAVIELMRHSFTPRLTEAAGLQPRRLDLFARLVRQVPVLRLSYPSGFENLPRVVEALLGDRPLRRGAEG